MDFMNPANPINLVNPASPWYYVWNTQTGTAATTVTTPPATVGSIEWVIWFVAGISIFAAVFILCVVLYCAITD